MAEGLTRVRYRFIEELEPRRNELVLLRDEITDRPLVEDKVASIARIAHKIAGTAETLGFAKLGNVAAELDEFIDQNPAVGAMSGNVLFGLLDTMIALSDEILSAKDH
jgi:HPt (histidine-containing phosphotransfer) domain-containing protein